MIRIVYNRAFDDVAVYNLEKRDAQHFISVKRIPKRYYNPYGHSSGVIMQYSFVQKALLQEEWDTIIAAFGTAKRPANGRDFSPDIDGQYLCLEIKTHFRCETVYIKGNFSRVQKRFVELLSQTI